MNEDSPIHKNLSTHQNNKDDIIDSFAPMIDNLQNMNRRNPADSTHQDNKDVIMDSFAPMIDNLQNINRRNPADSTCIRCIRRKFFCIVLFFLSIIMVMNFMNTVLEKLSQEDVQQIYKSMTKLLKKLPFSLTNMRNITVDTVYNQIQ